QPDRESDVHRVAPTEVAAGGGNQGKRAQRDEGVPDQPNRHQRSNPGKQDLKPGHLEPGVPARRLIPSGRGLDVYEGKRVAEVPPEVEHVEAEATRCRQWKKVDQTNRGALLPPALD